MESVSHEFYFYEFYLSKKNIKRIFGPKQTKLTIRQSESNIERLCSIVYVISEMKYRG